jgi:hypothetical protein
MSSWITLVAIVVLGFLAWNLFSRFGADRIAALGEKRRAGSRMVGRGEFVDGNQHLDVSLALTPSTFFYENADMEASLDLQWVREIEYDNELATGQAVEQGKGKVLRLRCNSRTYEFVLPQDSVERWLSMLPPRVMTQAAGAV